MELEIKGRRIALEGRKATIGLTLTAGEEVCATGEMLAVQIPAKPSST